MTSCERGHLSGTVERGRGSPAACDSMHRPSATLFRRAAVALILCCFLLPAVAERAEAQAESPAHGGTERIVGGPCEGCGEVFNGMPDIPVAKGLIAGPDEPGERMTIRGTVRRADGSVVSGVVVYAYHTDARGIYPPEKPSGRGASPHGRLRGWVRSGADGAYSFSTIRPMGYPNGRAPQHVHMHVIEPGRCTYFIDDIMFLDDPRVPADQLKRHSHGRGGVGLVRPVRGSEGEWVVTRDIRLGAGIADYAHCEGTRE